MAVQPLFSRQSGFGPLAHMLARTEGERAVEHLGRQEGVVLGADRSPAPLAFASMSRVFERAARMTGDDLFGLRVGGAMAPDDFGSLVTFGLSAATLKRCIARCGTLAQLQSNAVSLVLGGRGETAVWTLDYRRGAAGSCQQHALHILPAMMGSLRAYCGDDLSGLAIEAPLASHRTAAAMEDLLGVPVRTGAGRFGLAFPRDWLDREPRAGLRVPPVTLGDVFRHYVPRLPRSTQEAIRNVLPPLLANGRAQLDDVARQLGLSRRKLQSDLNGEGHLFRDILREARAARAMALMRESGATLAQIALAVGYSDQAHFHRAFSAVTGMAPGQWRALARPVDPAGR